MIKIAFDTSVYERIQKYNLLKMVGASADQLTAMTAAEAFIYCLIAVPVGELLSFVSLKIISDISEAFNIFDIEDSFSVYPVWYVQLIGIIICIAAVIISSYRSAITSAKKYTLTQAANSGSMLRSRKNSSLETKSSVSGLIRLYSKRNIKRTKGKYMFSAFCCTVCACIIAFSTSLLIEYSKAKKDTDFADILGWDNISEEDFFIDFFNHTYSDEINKKLELFKDDCSISIEKFYFPFYDKTYRENASVNTVLSVENEPYYEITNKYEGYYKEQGHFFVYSFDRDQYEKEFMKITNVSYDEVLKNRYVIISHLTNSSERYCSFKDMGYEEAPDFFRNDLNFKILGYYESDTAENGVIFPEEYTGSFMLERTLVSLKVLDGHDAEKVSGYLEDIRNDLSANVTNYYMKNADMQKKITAFTKLGFMLLLFFMLSGIVSVTNTTNTRILNSQRDYYILRCSGKTKKNVTRSVLREIILSSGISFLIGITAGCFLNALFILKSFTILPIVEITLLSLPFILITFALYLSVPVLCSIPFIKQMFNTSSEIVNSNLIR